MCRAINLDSCWHSCRLVNDLSNTYIAWSNSMLLRQNYFQKNINDGKWKDDWNVVVVSFTYRSQALQAHPKLKAKLMVWPPNASQQLQSNTKTLQTASQLQVAIAISSHLQQFVGRSVGIWNNLYNFHWFNEFDNNFFRDHCVYEREFLFVKLSES